MPKNEKDHADKLLEAEIAVSRDNLLVRRGKTPFARTGKFIGHLLWFSTGIVLWVVLWSVLDIPRIPGVARFMTTLLGLPIWIGVVLVLKQVPEMNQILKWLFPWIMMSDKEEEAELRMLESQRQKGIEDSAKAMRDKFDAVREQYIKHEISDDDYGSAVRKLVQYPADGIGNLVVEIQRTLHTDLEESSEPSQYK